MAKKILCVCKGNTCRSPMFAAVLLCELVKIGENDVVVESAGYLKEAAGQPAAPEWTANKSATKIDLSAHRSRWINHVDLTAFDTIICMESAAKDAVIQRGVPDSPSVILANAPYGVDNPFEKGQKAYDDCYVHIIMLVHALIPQLQEKKLI